MRIARYLLHPTLPLAALAVAAACVPLPGGRALAPKPIAAKEGDATLVAEDGSRCTVPPARFAALRIGEEVTCVWDEAPDRRRPPAPRDRVPPSGGTRP